MRTLQKMKVDIGPYPGIKSKKNRKIKVHIDDYDTWNLDHTLALIIAPAILKFKENLMSMGSVDDEDVPDEIRNSDDYSSKKWDWVLNEIYWAFNQYSYDWEEQFFNGLNYDSEGYKNHIIRMNNGFRLFGKYYRSLWD